MKLKVGDTVIVAVAKENREWGYNPAPDGTLLTVIGFGARYRGRTGEFGRRPGKYTFNDMPLTMREDNGKPVSIGSYHIRTMDGFRIDMDLDGEWREELPELPFCEGDRISCKLHYFDDSREAVVLRIDYNEVGKFCLDGITPYPIYTISPNMHGHMSTFAREADLVLVERGNVWKYYHGEPLHFDTIEDEAHFYKNILGRTIDIRNPVCDLYDWTIEEAVGALRDGRADAITVGGGLFGSKSRPFVNKFLDEDVGSRVRAESLKGWADFDRAKFADEIAEQLEHRARMAEMFKGARA